MRPISLHVCTIVLVLTETALLSVCGRVELLTAKSGVAHLAWQSSKQCCKAIQAFASVMDADIHSSQSIVYILGGTV